ncbi:MAG: BCCT family transporter, partial [Halofilum sp. (in: g-proteobacteria)]|nr:BCCT family transporter [Halofilum sp. (in: g-proteobacteria)]
MSIEDETGKEPYIQHTDYEVGQDNIQPFGLDIHNPVFVISGGGSILFVLLTMIFPESSGELFTAVRKFFETTFDWVYMGAANIFVIVCLILLLTPLGKVR